MYELKVPYKNFRGQARNAVVQLNLTTAEIFKLIEEFNEIFKWQKSMGGPKRELSTEEVKEFYTNLEEVFLSAYGQLSEDGEYFRKGDRYNFAESAVFSAAMMMFVTDPALATKILDGLMPKDLQEVVEKAGESVDKTLDDPNVPDHIKAQLREWRESQTSNE